MAPDSVILCENHLAGARPYAEMHACSLYNPESPAKASGCKRPVPMNKSRLEAFADAIFGFAATLLILGIALPEFKDKAPADADIASALLHLWPQLLTYLMSF